MSEFNLVEALEAYRDVEAELGPEIKRLEDLKKQIQEHCRATGEVATLDGVKVTIKQGYKRTQWDTKALEGFALAHPELLDLKRVYTTKPSVRIKVDPSIQAPQPVQLADPQAEEEDGIPF